MLVKKRYMRILFPALVALAALPAGAGAQSVNITLGRESVTVSEMMRIIEAQAGYHFSYNKNMFDISRSVTVERRTVTLQQALESMTGGQSAKFVIHKNYIAIVPAADNSRPQVRRQPAQRTSDVYRREDDGLNTVPAAREPLPQTPPRVAEVPVVQEPDRPSYSDYTPTAIYSDPAGRLPRFALKTNLFYGVATLTPNIAAEVAVAPRWTIEGAYSTNPWNYKAGAAGEPSRKLLHGIARLEGRYWFCERYSRHFVGVHALYSEYNVSGYDIPLLFEKEYRYHGNAWGGGLVYGYDLPIGKSWNLEFTAGVGVYRMDYRRYSCVVCSEEFTPVKKTWVGPSRLGVSIEFIIK
jgi:hypothetical protein